MNEQQSEADNALTAGPSGSRIWRALCLGSATVGAVAGGVFIEKLVIGSNELNNPPPPIDLTSKVAMGTCAAGMILGFFCADRASPPNDDALLLDTQQPRS